MFPNQDHGHLSVLEDGTLVITSVRADDAGEYLCKGLNIAGTAVAKVRLDVQGSHNLLFASMWLISKQTTSINHTHTHTHTHTHNRLTALCPGLPR